MTDRKNTPRKNGTPRSRPDTMTDLVERAVAEGIEAALKDGGRRKSPPEMPHIEPLRPTTLP